MVLDAGKSIIKAKIARQKKGEITFPHAMKQLTGSEYEKITNRTGIQNQSMDYMRINGKPYVIGEGAERHGLGLNGRNCTLYTRLLWCFSIRSLGSFI
jgi:hypothetical protein